MGCIKCVYMFFYLQSVHALSHKHYYKHLIFKYISQGTIKSFDVKVFLIILYKFNIDIVVRISKAVLMLKIKRFPNNNVHRIYSF